VGRRDLGRIGVDRGTEGTGALRAGVRPAVVGLRGVVHGATGEIDAGDRVAAQVHRVVERHCVNQGRRGGGRIAVVAVDDGDGGRHGADLVRALEGEDDQGRRHAGVGDDGADARQVGAGRVDVGREGAIGFLVFEGDCHRSPDCHGAREQQGHEMMLHGLNLLQVPKSNDLGHPLNYSCLSFSASPTGCTYLR
jgi:hypothetical protein